MKNTGKHYEAPTQQVFDRLLAQGNLVAQVERDAVVKGKATKRQIDVTFEFAAGGVSCRTIIQCKDWASPVKQEQVLAFQSVLSDIPGQPRGIIVSRSGFQEGARSVAEHNGIKLYELREPRDEDWDGLIKACEITMNLRMPRFSNVRWILDEPWVRESLFAIGVAKADLNLRIDPTREPLFHESGAPCDINAILNSYVPKEPHLAATVRHEFADDALLLETPYLVLPRIRVCAVEAEISGVLSARVRAAVCLDGADCGAAVAVPM